MHELYNKIKDIVVMNVATIMYALCKITLIYKKKSKVVFLRSRPNHFYLKCTVMINVDKKLGYFPSMMIDRMSA